VAEAACTSPSFLLAELNPGFLEFATASGPCAIFPLFSPNSIISPMTMMSAKVEETLPKENFRESQESKLNAVRSRQPPACLYGSSAKERQKATELTWSEIYRHKTILTKNKQCLATTKSLVGGN